MILSLGGFCLGCVWGWLLAGRQIWSAGYRVFQNLFGLGGASVLLVVFWQKTAGPDSSGYLIVGLVFSMLARILFKQFLVIRRRQSTQ